MKTDLQLRVDVAEELAYDPRITGKDIAVAVDDGVVTLTGTVPCFIQRMYAERAAKRVNGVRGIVEKIVVELPGTHVLDDVDIVHAAVASLDWSVLIPKNSVQVTVSNGLITLTGTVDWQYQKDEASKEVRGIIGVRDVVKRRAIASSWVEPCEVWMKARTPCAVHGIPAAWHPLKITSSSFRKRKNE